MKLNFKKTFNIVLIFLILLITLCAVSAQDNMRIMFLKAI